MFLSEIHLLTENISLQKVFYQSLGFSCYVSSEEVLVVEMSKSRMFFHQSDEKTCYHFCFLVGKNTLLSKLELVRSLDDKLLLGSGMEIVFNESWNSESVYFYDADNNIAEFIFHNNFDYSLPLTGNIIQIAEIGMVSLEPQAIMDRFLDEINVSCYKSTNTRFMDLGEPGAMFICVDPSKKNNWYPTDIVPVQHPCWGEICIDKKKIKFEIKNELIHFSNPT